MQQNPPSRPTGIGPGLFAVAQAWRRALSQALVEHDLSDATALPLSTLSRAGRSMRQNELAHHLGLEGTSVVRVLDSLERDGLVRRAEDPQDRRAKLVSLTAAGERVAETIEAIFTELRNEIMADIAPSDIEATERLIQQISAVLNGKLGKRRG